MFLLRLYVKSKNAPEGAISKPQEIQLAAFQKVMLGIAWYK